MTWFDLLKKHFLASNVFALTFVFLRQTLILLCGFRICLDQNEMNNASYLIPAIFIKLLEFLFLVFDSFMCL